MFEIKDISSNVIDNPCRAIKNIEISRKIMIAKYIIVVILTNYI